MTSKRTSSAVGVAAAAVAAGVLAVSGGHPAQAVTDGCLNVQTPLNGPVGCGALFLPNVANGSGNVLALNVDDHFLARAKVASMNSGPGQDFTVYLVCSKGMTTDRSGTQPCGSGGKQVPNEVVLRVSPDGTQPPGGVNDQASLCLTDDGGNAALLNCQVGYGGAYYEEGIADYPAAAVPPAVRTPPAAATWQLVPDAGGVALKNMHSGRYLDDPNSGGRGSKLITYSWNGSSDQRWQWWGCTAPFNVIKGEYGCPK